MSPYRINVLRIAVAVVAVVMIVYGISRGELSAILHKAINICFECIGLGQGL